ncbi:DUF4142 domain-containing protein [Pseudonocardia nantongensis]|uniref:DUF4142 domain-containing protein n=1 Tax=Pseudonocardia nantongensis TaxID=1181885 RepID=UPI00397D8DDF
MSRRIPGPLRWSILIALAAVAAVALAQSWVGTPSASGQGWTQTQWGPLGPADRDLLEKVRLAGLWEGPTGQQGEQQASAPAVRDVARKVGVEHHELDTQVRATAEQLGVLLPSRPSDQQIGWMNDLTARTGTDYDRQFVQILRGAHGSVLPLITEVRVGTRNELMRRFATQADAYVTRHIGYLESTGLVDYSSLPAPPDPVAADGRSAGDIVVPAVVVALALLAAGGLVTTLHRRGRPAAPGRSDPLGPVRGLIPAPRRSRDGAAPAPPGQPVGPPDPWDELARVPSVGVPADDPVPATTLAEPEQPAGRHPDPPAAAAPRHRMRTSPRSRHR